MKKVYLVITSWSVEENGYGYEVLGAYSNLASAEKKLEEDLEYIVSLHKLNKEKALKEKSNDFYRLLVNHNGIETISTKIIVKEVLDEQDN